MKIDVLTARSCLISPLKLLECILGLLRNYNSETDNECWIVCIYTHFRSNYSLRCHLVISIPFCGRGLRQPQSSKLHPLKLQRAPWQAPLWRWPTASIPRPGLTLLDEITIEQVEKSMSLSAQRHLYPLSVRQQRAIGGPSWVSMGVVVVWVGE